MTLAEVLAFARVLADSREFGFATPPEALAARILAGLEIGVPPIVAASNIGFQNGKLTVSASLQAALLNRSERWDVELVESTDDVCRLAFHDHQRGRTTEVAYHYSEAVAAKLPDKPSGKGQNPWKVYKADMVYASALKRGVKRVAASLLLGHAAYTTGDLGDPGPADMVTADPLAETPPALETVQDETPETGTAEAAAVEPSAPAEPQAEPLPTEPLATAEQVDALLGWQEVLEIHPDDWTEILGRRSVTDPGQLTWQQADDLLTALKHKAEQENRAEAKYGKEELVSFPPEQPARLPAGKLPAIEGAGYRTASPLAEAEGDDIPY